MLLVLSLGPCVQPRLCKGISTELHFWILGEPCATESLDKAQQYPGGIAETAWASQMFPDFILICHESCSHDMGMFDEVAKLAFEILNVIAGSQTHHSKSRSNQRCQLKAIWPTVIKLKKLHCCKNMVNKPLQSTWRFSWRDQKYFEWWQNAMNLIWRRTC